MNPASPPTRDPALVFYGAAPRPLLTVPLQFALGVSIALHALLLSIHFTFPEASRKLEDRALQIILVNSKSARKPVDPQALAQANLDGGGNTEANRRAKTPLPPSQKDRAGSELERKQRQLRTAEAEQQRLLVQTKTQERALTQQQKERKPAEQSPPAPTLSGQDLATSALAMARLEAEIAKEMDEYNKRPRKKFIGARTESYRDAQYVEAWRQKVERIGTLNYPQEARGRLYGDLLLSVTIKSDGSVGDVRIERSSGHKILDDAALRIVRMAAPYAPFPPEIRQEADEIDITRLWTFAPGDNLVTK
ncbi:MAG: TonB family protein [Betaproteobacteria bacterium]|nr:TonB family protein [Betaproteobacteria bacterium]